MAPESPGADDQGIALPLHLVFGRAGATQEAAAQDPAGGTVSTHTWDVGAKNVENLNANTTYIYTYNGCIQ